VFIVRALAIQALKAAGAACVTLILDMAQACERQCGLGA